MSWDERTQSLEAFRTDKCRTCRGRIEIGQRITRRPGSFIWSHLDPEECIRSRISEIKMREPEREPCFCCGSHNHGVNQCPEVLSSGFEL